MLKVERKLFLARAPEAAARGVFISLPPSIQPHLFRQPGQFSPVALKTLSFSQSLTKSALTNFALHPLRRMIPSTAEEAAARRAKRSHTMKKRLLYFGLVIAITQIWGAGASFSFPAGERTTPVDAYHHHPLLHPIQTRRAIFQGESSYQAGWRPVDAGRELRRATAADRRACR